MTADRDFMILAHIGARENRIYLTKVRASKQSQAEHIVLDMAYIGRHKCTVSACQAFDVDTMKTDEFVYNAMRAEIVDISGLEAIIDSANNDLRKIDEAEATVARCERQIRALEREMAEAKEVLGIQ